MSKNDLTKYPEEEFANRILKKKTLTPKAKDASGSDTDSSVPAFSNNGIRPEDGAVDMDGGVMLKTSEILDFAEGVDSD